MKVRYALRGDKDKLKDEVDKYAACVDLGITLLVISLSAYLGWKRVFADVESAFLLPDLKRQLWARMTKAMKDFYKELILAAGYSLEDDLAIEVLKAVYGLAEAAKLWRDKCDETLLKEGFTRCPLDDCLYMNSTLKSIIAVHVDDMNIIAPTEEVIQQVLKKLEKHFKITTKSESLLGMAITDVKEGTKSALLHSKTSSET